MGNPQATLDKPKDVGLPSPMEVCVADTTGPSVTKEEVAEAAKALVCGYANQAFELHDEEWTKLLSKLGFFPECTINAIPNEQLHNLVAIYELVKPDIVAMQEVVDFCHQWMKDPNRETLHDSHERQLTVETISYGNVATGGRGPVFINARSNL